jgi:hypothetical protein
MHAARRVITLVLLIQVAWLLPSGLVFGFLLDLGFLFGFGGGGLVVLAVLLSFMLVWQRADARREKLLTSGARVPAVLVSSRRTGTEINDRRVLAHTFEARSAGQVIRAEARAFTHLPVGTEATIAYDTTDPTNATVVEDLDRVAADGRLDWQALRQQQIDRTFRKQS